MPEARKKPCRICRRWFRPDPRVGQRQRACGEPDCQTSPPPENPSQLASTATPATPSPTASTSATGPTSAEEPEPLRVPPPLSQLPWDLAKDQFGGKGADFIGVMGTLILRAAKDQFQAHIH